jgi:hypothetical protein
MPAVDVNRGRRRSVNTRAPELATYPDVIECRLQLTSG